MFASAMRMLMEALPQYTPDGAITWLHEQPRIVGSNELPVDALFSGFATPAANEYAQGIAAMPLIALVIGLLLLLIIAIASCCACCRCCCCSKCGSYERGFTRTVMLISLLVLTGSLVVLGYVAVAPLTSAKDGFDGAVRGIGGVGDLFASTATRLDAVQASFNDLSSNAATLANKVRQSSQGTPASRNAVADQIENDMIPKVDDASTVMDGIGETLNKVARPIREFVGTLNDPTISEQYTSALPIAAAVTFASCSVILLLTLIPLSLCRLFHVPASVLVFVFGTVIWIVIAVVLAAGLVLSDICYDPVQPLTRIAQRASSAPILADSINYMTDCNASSPLPGDLHVITSSDAAVSDINASFAPALQDIRTTFSDDVAVVSAANGVEASLSTSLMAVEDAASSFGCRQARGMWVPIADSFCNKLVAQGLVGYWTIQLAVGIVLVLSLCCNMPVCFRHTAQDFTASADDAVAGDDVANPLPANVGAGSAGNYSKPLTKAPPA
ncbi:hypothetical protein FNF27_05984 [Cafeteria roenbergensis]|uniref:Uncharacterized protein n=1 Tax=Cafeteria roenbergensis TaxID=33653 RepID=A0A5A8E514_CAFRO|nr:hypothetical protein FNF27_05984 [Cafeteria roenbergensis]